MQRATAKIKGVLDKPEVKKVEKAKVAEPVDDEEEKIIKSSPGPWKVYEAKRKKWNEERKAWTEKETGFTTKLADAESQLKAAKSNPDSAANDHKIQFYEKRIEELSGHYKTAQEKLAERDYTQSPEYAEKFSKPWQRGHDEAYGFVEGLQVLDENGDPARQATKADFDKVMATPIQQRRQVAKALFGEDFASDIIDHAKELDRIRKGANDAVKDHAQNFQKLDVERTLAHQKELEGYVRMKEQQRIELETELPDMFSVEHYKDQPELQKALQDGYSDYDNIRATYHQMSPEDRAANEVLARAHYAAMPLMHKQVKALKTENESLKAELLRFRSSDPGGEKPGTAAVVQESQVGGISEMAKRFNE